MSCTGMYAPGLDIELVAALALPLHVRRTCVNFMGCYAAVNAAAPGRRASAAPTPPRGCWW
ncbi:MAG: hypothetical protein WKG07_09185 [Hymenobacter sp.]